MRWEFHSAAPIYRQVTERIERLIVSGALPPGARLPAIRTLAMEAGVNPNTVQKALTELERGGLIYSQRTAGHFVAEDPAVIAAAREALAEAQTGQYLNSMRDLGYTPEEAEQLIRRQGTMEGRDEHGDTEL